MAEILFNEELNNYTLQEINDNHKSIKKVPLKFKFNDKTSKYRKKILRKELIK